MIDKEIAIPADNDGFALLQCNLCGEFFKLKPNDVQSDEVLNLWCPVCGLISDGYLTQDVIDLALKMATNIANDLLFDSLKDMQKNFNGGFISMKISKKPDREIESPIVSGIEALEVQKYKCCKKQAKIKPLVKIFGSYCPYCGVKYDEFE